MMFAAGMSFNLPEDSRARIPVISLFFFLFMVLYSVHKRTPLSNPGSLTAAAWNGSCPFYSQC